MPVKSHRTYVYPIVQRIAGNQKHGVNFNNLNNYCYTYSKRYIYFYPYLNSLLYIISMKNQIKKMMVK